MSDVRRADPSARRRALVVIVAGSVAGALAIAAFEQYRLPLRDWILADPGTGLQRARWVLLLLGGLLIVPLLGIAARLWSFGSRVIQVREYPPPGMSVLRDTPVVTGDAAESRGRQIRALALACVAMSLVFGLFIVWISSMVGGHSS